MCSFNPFHPAKLKKPLAPTPVEVSLAPTPVEVSISTHYSHFSSSECWSRLGYSSNESNQDETFQYAFCDHGSWRHVGIFIKSTDMDYHASHLLDFQALALVQVQDAELQRELPMDSTWNMRRRFDAKVYLIVFAFSPTVQWRIYILRAKVDQVIRWYHLVSNCVDFERFSKRRWCPFGHSNLRTRIESLVRLCVIS